VLGLLAELTELGAGDDSAGTGKLNLDALAHRVDEVGVDDVLLRALDQGHEGPQLVPGLLQHRVGDVDPPLVGLDLLDEWELAGDDRDRLLILQRPGDLHDAAPLALEWLVEDDPQLGIEEQDVEPLAVFVLWFELIGQLGEPVAEGGQVHDGDPLP
jgi:hypothetical protein